MSLRVFLNHQLLGEFPAGYRPEVAEAGALLVVDPASGDVAAVFSEWHGAGVGLRCASATADPACTNCFAPAAKAIASQLASGKLPRP